VDAAVVSLQHFRVTNVLKENFYTTNAPIPNVLLSLFCQYILYL